MFLCKINTIRTSSYAGILSSFKIDQMNESCFQTYDSNIFVSIEFKCLICSRERFSSFLISISMIFIKWYGSILNASNIHGNNLNKFRLVALNFCWLNSRTFQYCMKNEQFQYSMKIKFCEIVLLVLIS